jgi:hypothetical protein
VAASAEAYVMIKTLMTKIDRIASARIRCSAGQANEERSQPPGAGAEGGVGWDRSCGPLGSMQLPALDMCVRAASVPRGGGVTINQIGGIMDVR